MSVSAGRILVVDDEPNIRRMLAGVLEDEGHAVVQAGDVSEARRELAAGAVDLMLLDLMLPGTDGLAFLDELRVAGDAPPVIMMSGHGSIQAALEATRLGAQDFIEKPIQPGRLLVSVKNGLRLSRLREENLDLREALAVSEELIGNSEDMKRLRALIARSAPSDARVLITGENGTGKELVARALHAASGRSREAFIKINCAAIPSELLESELFGHERGAFTGAVARRRGKFERAQGGTLLLDEIGDMNPATQAKLLRVLEEGEMERLGGEGTVSLDVRVLASTNRDLTRLLSEGHFREDLYHRLKVLPIHVPPLREHPEDVDELAPHYLEHFCRLSGRPAKRLQVGALDLLRAYSWPGNVRELRNLMERLVILFDETELGAVDLAPLLDSERGDEAAAGTLAERLEAYERRQLKRALAEAEGNVAAAARSLGLDRANLHRRLQRLGLKP